jgi:PAS domain S-box-containing protein
MNEASVILVVDDHSQNVDLLEAHLAPQGYIVVKAVNGEEALGKLSDNPIDLILLDVMMPGLNGFEVTVKIRQEPLYRQLPIILVTSLRDTEDRLKGIEAGCDDFLSKPVDKMELLARVRSLLKVKAYNDLLSNYRKELELEVATRTGDLRRAFDALQQETITRNQAEEHLHESEERYRRLVEFSPDAIIVHSSGMFVFVNPAAVRLLGAHDPSDLLGKSFFNFVHPEYREAEHLRVTTGLIEHTILPLIEEKFVRLDGEVIDVEVSTLSMLYDGALAIQEVVRDITEHKKLQQEVLQSQKMQSIGTIAGGIAHDFNNILAIILGYATLIEKYGLNAQKQSESTTAIIQTVQRGAGLVRQILTFARKTEIIFEPVNLADLFQELFSMLEQTFSKIYTFKKLKCIRRC